LARTARIRQDKVQHDRVAANDFHGIITRETELKCCRLRIPLGRQTQQQLLLQRLLSSSDSEMRSARHTRPACYGHYIQLIDVAYTHEIN